LNLKKHSGSLLTLASIGENIIITGKDGIAYKIIPITKPYPKFGSAKGLIEISDDFDAPIEGFEEYLP
jgi:antitoxin (DNA-binding transcriptional repressor) of toxin-antitoxin stability system